MENYLFNLDGNLEAISWSRFLEKEFKVGIAINKATGTTADGKLYSLGMNNLKDFSFVLEFEGLDIDIDNKLVKLGAENKTAYCEKINLPDNLIPKIQLKDNLESDVNVDIIFKLYLLTPAYFEHGWKPNIKDDNLKLISAVFGKPISIGGWDLKNKKPKPLNYFITAGSVYYFSCKKIHLNYFIEKFHGKSICEKKAKEGFGLVLMSLYKGDL